MRVYSATDVGQKRKMNQDYVFVSENPVGNLPNLFVVADGMGGLNDGKCASNTAVRKLKELLQLSLSCDVCPIRRTCSYNGYNDGEYICELLEKMENELQYINK